MHVAVVDEEIDKKSYSVAKVLVKAKPDQVWQVLTDYHAAPAIFPSLKNCHVVSEHNGTKVVHYQIKPSGVITSFQYDLELKETGRHRVDWKRVDGDFKEITGYWKLEPMDNGHSTLVTYASYVNGGLFMPQALIKRQVRIDVPQILTALKGQAESMQIATRTHPGNSN